MFTNRKVSLKVKAVALVSVFILSTASSCVIKDDNGGDAIRIDPPHIGCDPTCGCATDGQMTTWAYCMANK